MTNPMFNPNTEHQKNETITLRLTAKEKLWLNTVANEHHVSTSYIMRTALMQYQQAQLKGGDTHV